MAMTLSSRARYGVRGAMFQFASHWGEGAVTLRILALEKGLYSDISISWSCFRCSVCRSRLGVQ